MKWTLKNPFKGWIDRINASTCRHHGHAFDSIALAMFRIKTNSLIDDPTARITCNRCKTVFKKGELTRGGYSVIRGKGMKHEM